MMKCPKHKVDSASYRAAVMVCPECGRILDAGELLRLLNDWGSAKDSLNRFRVKLEKEILRKSHSRIERANNTRSIVIDTPEVIGSEGFLYGK
jgi:hypothetical protein